MTKILGYTLGTLCILIALPVVFPCACAVRLWHWSLQAWRL